MPISHLGGEEILAGQSVHHDITESQEEVLKFILDNYINFSAFTLSAMTHNEEPWLETPKNAIISDKLILDYYSKQPFAKKNL